MVLFIPPQIDGPLHTVCTYICGCMHTYIHSKSVSESVVCDLILEICGWSPLLAEDRLMDGVESVCFSFCVHVH